MKKQIVKKYYNNLNGIRNEGFKQPLTKEQMGEILKCANDPIYFIEKYIKIVSKPDERFSKLQKMIKSKISTKNKGIIPFMLRDYQKDVVKQYYSKLRLILKFPRQSGKSTIIQAICVHLAIFHRLKDIAVLANKDRSAKGFLAKIKIMIKHLPFWMQQGVVEWNKSSISFENGSSIISAATSADDIRGDTITDLILDEMAFIDHNIWGAFFASIYPLVSADEDARITFISTPNGYNHFYKFWKEAEEGISTFVPIEIKWDDVPGRDEKWKENTIRDVGDVVWLSEYECKFQGSGGALISGFGLDKLGIATPIKTTEEKNFRIYKYPEKDRIYLVINDVGEGVGADSSTLQILDVTDDKMEQVAVYENDLISTDDFPGVIEKISLMYNEALVIGENNSIGNDVLNDVVNDFEYENVFYSHDEDKHRYGIRMTPRSKKIGNSYLKRNIENDLLQIYDEKTIYQLSTYVKKGPSYAADGDGHDDLVTPLVHLSYFMRNAEWVEEWLDKDLDLDKRREKLREKIEDDIIPAGFVDRGQGIINLNEREDVSDW